MLRETRAERDHLGVAIDHRSGWSRISDDVLANDTLVILSVELARPNRWPAAAASCLQGARGAQSILQHGVVRLTGELPCQDVSALAMFARGLVGDRASVLGAWRGPVELGGPIGHVYCVLTQGRREPDEHFSTVWMQLGGLRKERISGTVARKL